MKMTLKTEDNLKNEDDIKKEDNIKNEDDLKNEDNLKNEDDLKKRGGPQKTRRTLEKSFSPPPQLKKNITWIFFMTSHLNSHKTTDI